MAEAEALGLEIVELPVAAIKPNPWNPNRQSEQVARAERESIQTFGFVDPVVVRPHPADPETWQIIDGEHRWRAAQDLGLQTIPAVILRVGDTEARRLTVILNETRGAADVALLGALLSELEKTMPADELLVGMPFTRGEFDHLVEIGNTDWDSFQPGGGDDTGGEPALLREVVLTYSEREYKAFLRFLGIVQREGGKEGPGDAVLASVKAYAQQLSEAQ